MKTSRSFALSLSTTLVLLVMTADAHPQTLVDIADDASDPFNEVDGEPSIAVNPKNPNEIRVVAFSGPWSRRLGVRAPVWTSTDGGVTWTKELILPAPNDVSRQPGDQKIAFDSQGTFFIVELAAHVVNEPLVGPKPVPPGCFVYRPDPASPPNYVAGNTPFGDDQPMIDVRKSELVVSSMNFGTSITPFVTTLDKSGKAIREAPIGGSGSPAKPIYSKSARIAVAPSGNVYAIYFTLSGPVPATKSDPDAIQFVKGTYFVVRSKDGVTWNRPGVPIRKAVTWNTPVWGDQKNGGRVGRNGGSDAWIATHPTTGEVWVAYCDRDPSTRLGQIWATHSKDGITWEPRVRVTDGTRHSGYPEIAVASNGTVGVLYMDYDASGFQTKFAHRFARLFIGQQNWSITTLQEFNPQLLNNGTNYALWYDYHGLTALDEMFYGVFCGDSEQNRMIRQFDPIFFKMKATP